MNQEAAATASGRETHSRQGAAKQIEMLGVPLDLGQRRRGVDMGPSALRVAGLEAKLEALGHAVTDRGNVQVAVAET
ncbi:MAG: arginase family protein, partial [Terracidiphilus sp.]